MSEREDIVITVEKRPDEGKGTARKMRRQGQIPAVVYGGDRPPVNISVDEHSLRELLKQEAGENTIFLLKLKGTKEERRAMIRQLQKDPISGRYIHIDFIRITAGQKIHVKMPVELKGDCVGVRHGGRVDFVTRELEIEILPREMFDKITVDISNLDLGHHISVGDLEGLLPPSARFVAEPGRVVALVETPKVTAAELAEEEAAAAELVISESAEPEVIRKGRGEEEEGE